MSKKVQEQDSQSREERVQEEVVAAEQPANEAQGDSASSEAQAEELETLRKELEEQKGLLEEQKKEYLYLRAEFDNYRKRTLREKAELVTQAAAETLGKLLPVVDDFDRALQSSESTDSVEALREGLVLIHKNLKAFMQAAGVTEIQAVGQPLDTDFHDAVTKIPAPSDELKGRVVDVIRKGYMLNGNVLRHAQVVIGE